MLAAFAAARRLVLVVMMPVLPLAPTTDAPAVVAGQVTIWKDAGYKGASLSAYASKFNVTYYYNLANDNFYLDDEVSSLAVGGIKRTTTCRLVFYRDHDLAGPKLVLPYKDNPDDFYVHDTGIWIHHARNRGNLKHSYYDNGQRANDNGSSFTIRCISFRV